MKIPFFFLFIFIETSLSCSFSTFFIYGQDTTPTAESTPPPTPAPEATATPAPTPDASAAPAAAPAADAATATPSPAAETPPVPAEQLKWPDAVEIEKSKDIVASNNKNITALFSKAEDLLKQISTQMNALPKSYDEYNKKFEETNTQVDDFIQKISFEKGKLNELVNPEKKNPEKK